jgi:hypothetical protein
VVCVGLTHLAEHRYLYTEALYIETNNAEGVKVFQCTHAACDSKQLTTLPGALQWPCVRDGMRLTLPLPAGIRTHIKTAHYAVEFPLPDSGSNDDPDDAPPTVSLSRTRRTAKAARTLGDADVDDEHERPKRGKKRAADDADYDDDNDDNDNDDEDDGEDIVDGDEHAAKAVAAWNSLATKVSDGWLCCDVVYKFDNSLRTHFKHAHEQLTCANCKTVLSGRTAYDEHVETCAAAKPRPGTAAASTSRKVGRPSAAAAAAPNNAKLRYVEALEARTPRPAFAAWLPDNVRALSGASAQQAIEHDVVPMRAFRTSFPQSANAAGQRDAAAAAAATSVARFESVAIDNTGAVLAGDSVGTAHEFVLGCGAPIWNAAFLHAAKAIDANAVQYLAITTHSTDTSAPRTRPAVDDEVPRVIQIWRLPANMPQFGVPAHQKPTCVLLLKHEHGPVRQLKWFPLLSPPDAALDAARIGVCAVVTADGLLRIVAVPNPAAVTHAPPNAVPVVNLPTVCSISLPNKEAVLCCGWSSDREGRYLAVGGGRGSVRVYDMVAWHDSGRRDAADDFLVASGLVGLNHAAVSIAWCPTAGMETMFIVGRASGNAMVFDLRAPLLGQQLVQTAGRGDLLQWLPHELSCGSMALPGNDNAVKIMHLSGAHRRIPFDETHVWSCDVSPFFVRYPIAAALQSGSIGVSTAPGAVQSMRSCTHVAFTGTAFVDDKPDELVLWRGGGTYKPLQSYTIADQRLLFLSGAVKQTTTVAWSRCMSSKDWLAAGSSSGLLRLICVTDAFVKAALANQAPPPPRARQLSSAARAAARSAATAAAAASVAADGAAAAPGAEAEAPLGD